MGTGSAGCLVTPTSGPTGPHHRTDRSSVIFTLRSPVFLSAQNIRGMLADSSLIIVLALGLTFVIAIGGIDLSIATTVTLASVMMGVAHTRAGPFCW